MTKDDILVRYEAEEVVSPLFPCHQAMKALQLIDCGQHVDEETQ